VKQTVHLVEEALEAFPVLNAPEFEDGRQLAVSAEVVPKLGIVSKEDLVAPSSPDSSRPRRQPGHAEILASSSSMRSWFIRGR
jgi:hypothetical protein